LSYFIENSNILINNAIQSLYLEPPTNETAGSCKVKVPPLGYRSTVILTTGLSKTHGDTIPVQFLSCWSQLKVAGAIALFPYTRNVTPLISKIC